MTAPVGNGRQTINNSTTPRVTIRIKRDRDAAWETFARSSSKRAVAMAQAVLAGASPDAKRPATMLRMKVQLSVPAEEPLAEVNRAAVANHPLAAAKAAMAATEQSLRAPRDVSSEVRVILAIIKAILEEQKLKSDAT